MLFGVCVGVVEGVAVGMAVGVGDGEAVGVGVRDGVGVAVGAGATTKLAVIVPGPFIVAVVDEENPKSKIMFVVLHDQDENLWP